MALIIEVAGFAVLAVAAVLWNLKAGLAITGVELLVLGFLLDYTGVRPSFPRPKRRRKGDKK